MKLPKLPAPMSTKSRPTSPPYSPKPIPSPKANSSPKLFRFGSTSRKHLSINAEEAYIRSRTASLPYNAANNNNNNNKQLEEELRQAFAQFDANGDGKISAEELCAVMRSLGDVRTTPQEAVLMVADVDADGDGFIDLQEFIHLNLNLNRNPSYVEFVLQQQEELAAAFAMFDLDKNGRISPEELHTVLINLGNRKSSLDDCRRMICGVDRKGSGQVDFDDFKTMMIA